MGAFVKVILSPQGEGSRLKKIADLLFLFWIAIVLFFFLKGVVLPRFFEKFGLWNM